jgi:hypothetical protein
MNNKRRANIALHLNRLAEEMWCLSNLSPHLTKDERSAIIITITNLEYIIRADDDLART